MLAHYAGCRICNSNDVGLLEIISLPTTGAAFVPSPSSSSSSCPEAIHFILPVLVSSGCGQQFSYFGLLAASIHTYGEVYDSRVQIRAIRLVFFSGLEFSGVVGKYELGVSYLINDYLLY